MNLIICAISFVLLVIGIVLTVAGFKKDDWKNEPKILSDHKKQLKVIGPIVIALSIALVATCFLHHGSPKSEFAFDHNDNGSEFGFKFY